MKQRIVSFALIAILCLTMLAPAHAVESSITPQQAADYLYEHGLFKGTGTGQDGKANYNLDKTATRAEGITMFVRLLSKETEVTTNTYTTPFTDVPTWAKGYVGYAYENGLTKGTSSTTFSSTNIITAYEFMTLCLRALGYKEGTDFTYSNPRDLAISLGLFVKGWETNTESFNRADMVMLAYNTLFAKKANGGTIGGDNNLDPAPPITLPGGSTEVKEVDADDKSNLWDDGNGGYMLSMDNIPDGTIISRDDLVYTDGASIEENLIYFILVLSDINPNLSWTGKAVSYFSNDLTYITAANGVWNLRIGNWVAGKDARNVFLTSMAYFGNKGMASAVYGMLNEHYTLRSDINTPIPASIASNYGLTITSESVTSEGRVSISVTNGPSTWTVTYCIDNSVGATSATVKINVR